jgi:hypothetical protein
MDGEMFSNGGMKLWGKTGEHVTVDSPKLQQNLQLQQYKFFAIGKLFLRVALIVMIVWIVLNTSKVITEVVAVAKWIKNGGKSSFTQKEGLQYLGASLNSIRGDLELQTDSLAEQALRQQNTITSLAPKSEFTVRRERMEETPEEKLLKGVTNI